MNLVQEIKECPLCKEDFYTEQGYVYCYPCRKLLEKYMPRVEAWIQEYREMGI